MTEPQKGALALLGCYTIWGLSSAYYRALSDIPSLEILAHRTVWTLVFFGGWIAVQGRLGQLAALLHPGRGSLGRVALAAGFISINWFLFIDTVAIGKALEASLGYYIFPLVSIVLGYVFFGERLTAMQQGAVALAAAAVVLLALGLGVPPLRALALAMSFAAYGAIKKGLDAGPVLSVTAETVLLAPLALVWLIGAELAGWGQGAGLSAGAFGSAPGVTLALLGAGILTGLPLVLFSFAARRVTLISVGIGQYYNSTLQFALAVLVFAEPFTRWHGVTMPLIWAGLGLYLVDAWRRERQSRSARRAATRASIEDTVVK